MKKSDDIQWKDKCIWNVFLILTIIEGIISEIVILSIERDVKNVRFFGLSYSRLVLVGTIFLLLLLFVFLLFSKAPRDKIFVNIRSSSKSVEIIKWISIILVFFLWYVIWIPASRLGTAEATFTRLHPFLIWIGLIGTQAYVFVKLANDQFNLQGIILYVKKNKKFILVIGIFVFLSGLLYYLLRLLPTSSSSYNLYFPPGAPLSGFQVFSCWAIFAFLFLFENGKNSKLFHNKTFAWATFFTIWAITILLWTNTSFPCTDDRPGPYPPNYVCYPQVGDAMYNIGSHYIALGQGISNQDKPLYVIFLAIGQWIFGPTIDHYIMFQIIVLALIPSLLFLLGKRIMGYAGGLFLAALMVIQEIYSINLYDMIGSVNVKLESPELLTAFLLIILCIVLFTWLKSPGQKKGAILSGGVLGLTILVRFNVVMIVPVILVVFWIANRKNKKIIMTGLSLFILMLSLTSLPGFLAQGTSSEGNFIIGKINMVISSRIMTINQFQNVTPTTITEDTALSLNHESRDTGKSEDNTVTEHNLNDSLDSPIPPSMSATSGIVSHFFNNYYSSLAKLPTELMFVPITGQISGNIWNFHENRPIWREKITFQNAIAMLLNLSLISLGIVKAVKRFGFAGLSALMIQLGYHFGNAAAMTSGGRYLEPVFWVTLVYYVMGWYALTIIILNFLRKDIRKIDQRLISQPEQISATMKHENKAIIFLLAGFLTLALFPPLSAFIPDQLPEQSSKQTNQAAYQYLAKNNAISETQWQLFLSNPNSLVVEGIAYNPRYYRSGFFPSGNPRFEVMVLGKQNVIISYMGNVIPTTYFSDGSEVILVGCRLADDSEWYADLTIMETYALFQVDHEMTNYIDGDSLPTCRMTK